MPPNFADIKRRLLAEREAAAATSSSPASSATPGSTAGGAPGASGASPPFDAAAASAALALSLTAERFAACRLTATIPTVFYVPDAASREVEAALLACVDAACHRSRWVALKARRLQQWGGVPTARGLQEAEALPPWLACLVDALMAAGVFPPDKRCVGGEAGRRGGGEAALPRAPGRAPAPSLTPHPPTHPPATPPPRPLRRPNHCLINEYLPGQGILPHTDGPTYFPCVATLSLGSAALMRYQRRGACTPVLAELLLAPASLVVTTGEAYTEHMHSIEPVAEEVVGATGAPCVNLAALGGGMAGVAAGDVLARGRRVSLTIRHVPPPQDAAAAAAAAVGEEGGGAMG